MKKNTKQKQYRNDDAFGDRVRFKPKAAQQYKDAKKIEHALKRKDYKMLSEELY